MLTLTRPQIESMPAGREMDIAVASVLGYTNIGQPDALDWCGRHPEFPNHPAESIPRFSTDDNAARKHVAETWTGDAISVFWGRTNAEWTAEFFNAPDENSLEGCGETIALALCRARLLAALEMQKEAR